MPSQRMWSVTLGVLFTVGACASDAIAPDRDADHLHAHVSHSMMVDTLVTELGAGTKVAANANGNFSAAATWVGGVAPGPDDVVVIPVGKTVTVNSTTAIAKSVIVRGTLRFAVDVATKLRVETLVVTDGGTLLVGEEGNGVSGGVTATIAIRDDLPVTLDSARLARGLIASHHAMVRMVSALPRDPFVAFANNLGPATTGNLATTTPVPANWRLGDQLVIPATEFTREWQPDMLAATSSPTVTSSRLKNELRTIAAISRTAAPGLTLDSNLAFQHHRADLTEPRIRVHAANLTRNIVILSEHPSANLARAGHAMFMGNDVHLIGVQFNRMGRTNKRTPVSDPGLPTSVYNTPGVDGAPAGNRFSNPRGRYAVHFHEAGSDSAAPAIVRSCAVIGTPGWGYVNHSSWVNFVDNVAFDYRGAGFVAEDGEEVGAYLGNIAIGGLGNGEFSDQRTVFGNAPRMDQGDMGFTGEGFWLQSPDVVVRNNIAAGNKGAGFFFWTAGKFEPAADGGHYTGRPLSRAVAAVIKPRKWDYDGDGAADANVISDFPLAGFSGNTAYGSFTGLRFRFVNNGNENIFLIRGKDLSAEFLASASQAPGSADRARFAVSDSTFWNNLNGIHATYLGNADLSNILIVAARPARAVQPAGSASTAVYRDEAGEGAIGVDFHFNNRGNTLTNVTIKNYTTCLWRELSAAQVPNVDSSKTTLQGCTERVLDAGNAKGRSFFFLSTATDNIPDNPQ
jgi:hypothetical protein